MNLHTALFCSAQAASQSGNLSETQTQMFKPLKRLTLREALVNMYLIQRIKNGATFALSVRQLENASSLPSFTEPVLSHSSPCVSSGELLP